MKTVELTREKFAEYQKFPLVYHADADVRSFHEQDDVRLIAPDGRELYSVTYRQAFERIALRK